MKWPTALTSAPDKIYRLQRERLRLGVPVLMAAFEALEYAVNVKAV